MPLWRYIGPSRLRSSSSRGRGNRKRLRVSTRITPPRSCSNQSCPFISRKRSKRCASAVTVEFWNCPRASDQQPQHDLAACLGDRQTLPRHLLLDLISLETGAFLGHVGINDGAQPALAG